MHLIQFEIYKLKIVVKIILKDNFNIILQRTPLHMAILGGSAAITNLLIKNGADVSAKDTEGERPIHYAAAENQEELIVMLTKGGKNSLTK